MNSRKHKRRSRITAPKDGITQSKMAAFRCDDDLKKLLDGMDDKSEFIRNALLEAFEHKDLLVKCPHCKGHGKVFKPKIRKVS